MKTFKTGYKNPLIKLLLIMKLTTLILFIFSLHVSASGLGQKLNLNFKKTQISVVLNEIEKQSNYRFLYNNELQAVKQKINVNVKDAVLKQVLDDVLANTGLSYQFLENNLVVINDAAAMPNKTVTGKITGENGQPLAGVSVKVKGETKGVVTNEAGIFSINVKETDVLIFSYVGYDDIEMAVGSKTEINTALVPTKKDLEQVIVVGYGSVKKKNLTGAVASIKGEEVVKIPAGNVMESVQGKLAGVDIVRTSGGAGANVSVTVRGNRSINAANGPLYIVDGIQYSNYQDVNPNDVQSMEVLKDAASTAIYGSRGANGVILITTKKGSAGKLKVSANAYYGSTEVAGYPLPMTGPQFADLKRQASRTAGVWNSTADDSKIFTNPADLAAVQNGVSTYWPGLLINKGSQQDYSIGVSAGGEKTKVYFSFDYFKEKGILNNDYSGRYSLRLNIDQTITNNFKLGLQSQLAYYDQNLRQDGILTVANKVIPYFTPYDANGNLVKFPGNGNQVNPLLEEVPGAYVNQFNTTRLLSTAYAEWKPFSGFTLRSNLGITNGSTRNGFFQDANTIDRALSTGSLSKVSNSNQTDLTWENIIGYQKKFGNHSLDATVVTSYLSFRNDESFAQATGQLLPGQSWYALQNNPANLSVYSNYVGSNLISGTFRINYGYKDRYLLTVTGRADGASVLAASNKWSYFPSAAAAWRVIDENFMKNQRLFSDLKLRVSYGVAGNAAVKPYQTQSTVVLIPYEWNDVSALAYSLNPQIGNPNLGWEYTGTWNFGLDFSFLKNRITVNADYYDSKTHDLIYLRQLAATSGAQSILQNIGKTHNSGIEIAVNTINVKNKNFTWSSGLTFSLNKEKIVDLVNGQSDIANKLFIGSPIRSFYDYQKEGIWQTADSTLAKSFGYKPGDIRVADISGPAGKPDGKIDATYDRTVVGSAVPKYSFGFNNDFKFNNFDLNIYIFGRMGQTFVSDYANKFEPNAIENGANVNYWTPENPTNDYPRPNVNISRAALPFATTLGYKDGSFLKIRNITLGYNLPQSLTKKWHLGNLRFYVSAKNYITFSKVSDYDPEGSGSFERPLTKLIVTGLNVDF